MDMADIHIWPRYYCHHGIGISHSLPAVSRLVNITLYLKKRAPLTCIFTYMIRLRQFLAQMLPRKKAMAIKVHFIFPPHLTSASSLPRETGNPEIASFHLNAACFFSPKNTNQLKISPGQS